MPIYFNRYMLKQGSRDREGSYYPVAHEPWRTAGLTAPTPSAPGPALSHADSREKSAHLSLVK